MKLNANILFQAIRDQLDDLLYVICVGIPVGIIYVFAVSCVNFENLF